MKRYAEKRRDAHLMNVAVELFAGVDENEALHDKYQKKSGQDRPTEVVGQHPADFRQHVKKNRTQKDTRAEAQQERQGSLRELAQKRQEAADQGDENDRR